MWIRYQRGNRSLKYTIIRAKNWRVLCPHYGTKAKILFILWNDFQTILLFANWVGLTLIADTILFLHFCIVIFLTSGLFLVPIGYKLDWGWTANLKLRLCHIGLMGLVALETFLGITCPLTFFENHLRGVSRSESFIGHWINQIMYWDLPTLFFIILYAVCLGWVFLMWKLFPPR